MGSALRVNRQFVATKQRRLATGRSDIDLEGRTFLLVLDGLTYRVFVRLHRKYTDGSRNLAK